MRPPRGSIPIVHYSLAALRVLSGLALIYYQGWDQFSKGWRFLWSDERWMLVEHFRAEHSPPVAVLFAFGTAVFYFVSPLFLMIGFLTRINALLIFVGLLITLNANLDGVLSTSLHTQTMVLYFLITLFFGVNGGGMIAADRLFDRSRGRFRAAGGLYHG